MITIMWSFCGGEEITFYSKPLFTQSGKENETNSNVTGKRLMLKMAEAAPCGTASKTPFTHGE
jgi:hypothetical protein